MQPVDETQAPDYYQTIKFPIGEGVREGKGEGGRREEGEWEQKRSVSCRPDLQYISERLRQGYYTCIRLFIADVKRVFTNCQMYNEKGTELYKCAVQMEKFFISKMKASGLWFDLNVF